MVDLDIKVSRLTRVEGEGNIYLKVSNGKVERLEVGIFEAPRFFEAFLVGKNYLEVPDITARICGICPIPYLFSSSRSFEKLFGAKIPEEIQKLRKTLLLAEWIGSHVLHVFFLHAPDFLKCDSVIDMARDNPNIVKKALKVKAWGNRVIEKIGGRSVHPVSCRVGGFYRIIRKEELEDTLKTSEEIQETARDLLEWVMKLKIPDRSNDLEYVSLRSMKGEYPLIGGRVVSSKGLNISEEEFEENSEEFQVPYSTALRYRIKNRGYYLTGPSARYNNNYNSLRKEVREVIEKYGYEAPLKNTYQSIVARAAETYHATLEIERLLREYKEPKRPYAEYNIKAGWSCGITEAPRGILYHAYKVDEGGRVIYANIVAPTSQNLACMEQDLLSQVPKIITLEYEDAKLLTEQTIRNYDPCISCSAHFIKLKIDRVN